MEVDLQSLVWCAQLYSLAETTLPPPHPPLHLDSYTRALLVSKDIDDISLQPPGFSNQVKGRKKMNCFVAKKNSCRFLTKFCGLRFYILAINFPMWQNVIFLCIMYFIQHYFIYHHSEFETRGQILSIQYPYCCDFWHWQSNASNH